MATVVLALLAPPAPTESPEPTEVGQPEHREELTVLDEAQLDEARARGLFAAGKQAAESGRWDESVRFFAEAYRYSGSPGQLYSLGRAHRQLYLFEGRDPVQLRLALLRFRQYLERSPDGRNRDNASTFIAELTPYVEVLEGFDDPTPITRLFIHSPIDNARVSVDGADAVAAPATVDVVPGSHRVTLSADGYHDATRTVDVPEGASIPLEIAAQARDAGLTVAGPRGAALFVDGQRTATLPLPAAVELPAGPHQIAVARRGHVPFIRELQFSRGHTRDVAVELPVTAQRKLSWAGIGVGAGGLVAAGTLTGLSLVAQRRARDIDRERQTMGVTVERFAQADAAWQRRDALRTSAIVTGVVGCVLLGTGIVLYFTDAPRLKDRLFRPEQRTLASVVLTGRL